MILFWILKIIIYIPFRILYPTRFINRRELKKHRGKGVIFVCTHKSRLDPIVTLMLLCRRLDFWVKQSLMKNWFMRWALRVIGRCYPVSKGNDLALMRHSIGVLKKGRALMIYPEGTRVFNEEDALAVRNGAAMVAIKAGVPIVPMVLKRSPRLFTPNAIKIGETISVEQYLGKKLEKSDLNELSEKISASMAALLDGFEVKRKQKKWERIPGIISRGIVFVKERLLVVKRARAGRTYFVLPGGHMDPEESARDAAVREIKEETNVTASAVRLLYKYENKSDPTGYSNGMQNFFLCEYKSGDVAKTDAEEYTGGAEAENARGTYEPMTLSIEELKKSDLRPACVKRQLLKDLRKYGMRMTRQTKFLK
jgi:1-acyl-sn-glycerol-3-phosphate acyltransferase